MSEGEKQEKSSSSNSKKDDYGYHFYPERSASAAEPSVAAKMSYSNARQKRNCFKNITWCMDKHPMVKLLVSALKSQGCPVSLSRHVSCEQCISKVNGGFDPENKQVVVCENNSGSRNVCCSVLAHELIHMFDYCRADVDFKNIDHLACSEIRAAALMHCSFASAVQGGVASIFNYRAHHQECVKRKALMSVVTVRNLEYEEGMKVIDKVFDKCYNDLEPFGRFLRAGSRDGERCLAEGFTYGYTDRRT